MLYNAELQQASQLIAEADRAINELGEALKATRAQLDASREVTGLMPRSEGLGGEVSQITDPAVSRDEG